MPSSSSQTESRNKNLNGASRKRSAQQIDPNKIFNVDIRRDLLRKQYLLRTTGDTVEKTTKIKSIFDLSPKPTDGLIKRSIKRVVNPFGMPYRIAQIGGTFMVAYYMLFKADFGGDKTEEETVLGPIRRWHRRQMQRLFSLSEEEMEIVRLKEKKERELKAFAEGSKRNHADSGMLTVDGDSKPE